MTPDELMQVITLLTKGFGVETDAKTSKTKQTKTQKQNTKNHRKNKSILTHYNNNHTHNDFPPTMLQNRR